MKKVCLFCKQEKEHYAKGFCRNCYARYNKRGTAQYYIRQSEEERKIKSAENYKKYKKENPEKVAIIQSNYYKKNKERISNYKKQWYQKNKERILEKYRNNNVK